MLFSLSNKRSLVTLLSSLLEPHGFVRVKDDWYLDNNECVSVVGLGKSLYGGQYSISIAILLKQLSPSLLPYPPFHLCHFRQNIKFVVPASDELVISLNLENNLLPTDRVRIITDSVANYATPFLQSLSKGEIIALEIKNNDNFSPYCRVELKEFLGIPI